MSLCGLLFTWIFTFNDYRLEEVNYKTSCGYNVHAILYLPKVKKPPVVITCHGVVSTQKMMHSFSVEMCRAGYAVLVPSLKRPVSKLIGNIDFSDYITGGIDYLATREDVDKEKIALMGHSWGGDVAYTAGTRSPEVKTVISYGMSIYTLPDVKPSILLACGCYDLLHPPEEMLLALRESSGYKDQKTGEISGNIDGNTGRKLVISPFSDHSSEIIDPLLIKETVNWLNLVFARTGVKSFPVMDHYRIIASNIRNLGFFLCFFYISCFILRLFLKSKRFPLVFSVSCFIIIFILKCLSSMSFFVSDLSFILFQIMLLCGFLFRNYVKGEINEKYMEEKFIYVLKFIFIYIILIWSSFILPVTLLRVPFFLKNGLIVKIPFMIIFKFFTDWFFYFDKMESLLGLGWFQGWLLFFLTVFPVTFIEAFKPGFFINIFTVTVSYIFRKKKEKNLKNKKNLIFMVILLFVASLAWFNLIKQGVGINIELISGLLWLCLRLIFLPITFFLVFYRILCRFSWFPAITEVRSEM
jgi:hypothetical protein